MSIVNKIAKNKVFHYIGSRYLTYIVQFINSVFIAAYLGPFYLGIWGFITLVIQYLNQINFGIAHSVNAIASINKNKEWYIQKVIGTSVTMLGGLSALVILFFITIQLFNLEVGNKYNFLIFAPAVVAIGILAYFNTLFSNIFRVYGRVTEVAINQSAFPIFMLVAIFVFRGENLLWALVAANLLSVLIAFFIYVTRSPIKLKPIFIERLAKKILQKGLHLFVYSTSFYLIVISTRSFISAYYSVEEFGYFTFAFSLANTIILLLNSFSYLIFPKILNRFANSDEQSNNLLLQKLRDTYITSSHFLAYIALLLFPVLLIFLPQYKNSYNAFSLIALTVVLYSNSFGYSGLLIAKGFEKKLGIVSFSSLLLNLGIVFILTHLLKVPFYMAILATMFTYLVYVYLITKIGRQFLKLDGRFGSILKDSFPLNLIIPYITAVLFSILNFSPFLMLIPLCLFLILNIKAFYTIKVHIKQFILNPNITDI